MPSSRLRTNAVTAAPVPVLDWPYNTARTLASVAASASNDESRERMASTCVTLRPDAGAAGVGVVEGIVATGAADPPPPPPPPPLLAIGPPPLEVLVVVVLQAVLDGVTVTVTAPETAGMVTVLTPLLQLAVIPPVAGSVETDKSGALSVMAEADCIVAVKLVAPTAMVSIVALEPLTLTLTLFTVSITSFAS